MIILGKRQTINYALEQYDEIRQTSLYPDDEIKNVIYINDPEIPFETFGEENFDISPYDFMD